MNTKLQMVFKNQNNSNITISVDDPREDLTGLEVKTAMDTIVAGEVFESRTGKIVSAESAKIVTTEIRDLEI